MLISLPARSSSASKFRLFAAICFVLSATGVSHSETLSLEPTGDGFIRAGVSAGVTNNEGNVLFLVGDTETRGDYLRAVLKYDLSRPELKGAKIRSVKLVSEYHGRDTGGGGGASRSERINLHALSLDFKEASVDWQYNGLGVRWAQAGGDFEPALAVAGADPMKVNAGQTLTFESEDLARAVRGALGSSLSFLVKLDSEDQERSVFRFKSGRSRLIIDYEPSPEAVAALKALRAPLPGQPRNPMEGVTPVPGNPETSASANYYLVAGGHPVEVKSELYDFDVAMFTTRGDPVLVDVMVQHDFQAFSVKPDRHQLNPERLQNALRFTLTEPLKLVVQIPGRRPLAIIVTPEEVDVPSPSDPDVLYFGPGVSEAGVVRPQSGQTVYLAPGALVRGRIEARSVENVQIRGRGLLDTSGYAIRDEKLHGILFEHAENIVVEGIGVRSNNTWWQTLFLNTVNAEVAHVNLFGIGVNTDGVDIDAVKNFVVRDSFIRAEDDGLGWHSLDAKENGEMITENALADNLVIWNTGAGNGIRIGASMEAQLWRDITIRNVDILQHAGAGIYSDYSDWARMENLRFKNVVIEKPSKPIRFYIDKTRYSNATGYLDERGHFDRLLFENVRMNGGEIRLTGYDASHRINAVRFNNCVNAGVRLESLDQVVVNEFVTDIAFNRPLPEAPRSAPGIFEAEACESRVSGSAQYIADVADASQGRLRVFDAKSVGDYIVHDLEVPSEGSYKLALLVRRTPASGTFEVSLNHGPVHTEIDLYSPRPDYQVIDCGELEFGSSGLLEVRLTVTGKHRLSAGYRIELDAIKLLQE